MKNALADWLLVVWILGRPEFRQRLRNEADFGGRYADGVGLVEVVCDFETRNPDDGFIAEWNHFVFNRWFGWHLDEPLDRDPSKFEHRSVRPRRTHDGERVKLDAEQLADQEKGSDLRVFGELVLHDVLQYAKLAAVEGKGFSPHGSSPSWSGLGLMPEWELWVRLSDLSPEIQQAVKTVTVSEEDANTYELKMLWWLLDQLQRRPEDSVHQYHRSSSRFRKIRPER